MLNNQKSNKKLKFLWSFLCNPSFDLTNITPLFLKTAYFFRQLYC